MKPVHILAAYVLAFSTTVIAQTVDTIPRFSSNTTLTDSAMRQNNGVIQVLGAPLGTSAGNSVNLLTIQNSISNLNQLEVLQIRSADGSDWTTGTTRIQNVVDVTPQGYLDFNPANGNYALALGSHSGEKMRITDDGKIGINTAAPGYPLTLGHVSPFNMNTSGQDQVYSSIAFQNTFPGGSLYTNAIISAVQPMGAFGDAAMLTFATGAGSVNERMRITHNGLVGIGTTTPSTMLEVKGSIKLTAGTGASMTYPDGTVQSTAWNGTTCGGDYAESVDVVGERATYEPGDVLVIAPKSPNKFLLAGSPYSKLVAGVFSTKPGLTGRRQITPKTEDEIPMAIVGIVPTKVSAENGAIEPGDLLVSSATPGYAMKGTEAAKLTGAIIGKAMGNLDAGKGVIEVLISLQ